MTRHRRLLFAVLTLAAAAQGALAQGPRLPPVIPPRGGAKAIPRGVILVPGATASASDTTTPLPEGAVVGAGSVESRYFGFSYRIPAGWMEKVKGPPPSDSGSYVLSLLVPSDAKASIKGSILIEAQDLFFTSIPASNALELLRHVRGHLHPAQEVEREPAMVRIGGHDFARLDYVSPDLGLHWHIVAADMRCHVVQFIFSGPDPAVLDGMIAGLSRLGLPAGGGGRAGGAPLCVAGYAVPDNILERVAPVLTAHRFNAIPVRIVIDRKGRVKHVHIISAFAEQSAALMEALRTWRFKPYRKDGRPMEIETGILFGHEAK
jgi:hypothetical protein